MTRIPKENVEISKDEEVLQMKYEENNKITKQFMEEINEMKSKIEDYDKHNILDVKHKLKPTKTTEFNTFMKIIDNGDTIEEHKTISSKEITVKNYVLQKEIDRLNNELLKKDDLNDQLQNENKKLTEEKNKYVHQISLHKDKIKKHDREVELLTASLKTRDSEVNRLLKDLGSTEKKFKHEQVVYEKQKSTFVKMTDENKHLKETVKKLETTLKEAEEKFTKMLSKNDDVVAKCIKEKEVLLMGFRKQLELIDSLKKQNARTKLQDEINILETEFSKLLESK